MIIKDNPGDLNDLIEFIKEVNPEADLIESALIITDDEYLPNYAVLEFQGSMLKSLKKEITDYDETGVQRYIQVALNDTKTRFSILLVLEG